MRKKGYGMSSSRVLATVVLVLIALGLAFFLIQGTRGPASSGTSISSTTNTSPQALNVTDAYMRHLDAFEKKSVCSFSQKCVFSLVALNDYSDQSLVVWEGNSGGLNGNYSGLHQIQLLYQTMNAVAQSMKLNVSSLRSSGNQLDLRINIAGFSGAIGNFNGTIIANVTYSNANGTWSIGKEVWDYTTFADENPGGATTFPQWRTVGGPISESKSPDSFKQFVYDYGGEATTVLVFSFVAAIIVMHASRRWR